MPLETPYDIRIHKHRYAAWAAGRASSTKNCRMTVEVSRLLIESVQLQALVDMPDLLPEQFDQAHREWRKIMVDNAPDYGVLTLTHGVAAKLINIYLKGVFTCGGHEQHAKVKAIHPPVDRLLLTELANQDVGKLGKKWRKYANKGWSNFSCEQYESVITLMSTAIAPDPLWMIESYWRGYR